MDGCDSPADLERRFWDGNSTALRCIRRALGAAEEVRIGSGFFEASGFRELSEVLEGKRIYLLVGREEGGEDSVRRVMQEFREELSCAPQERLTQAMRQLLTALEQGWLSVAVGGEGLDGKRSWLDARYRPHHAKVYIADEQVAVVGSPNMSRQGLCRSHEAAYAVTDGADVTYFVRRFQHYFERAEPITAELIEVLRQWLMAYDPYTVYARTLLELYGLPAVEAPPLLPRLARYQEGVTSSVLSAILSHDCAFLVASTGLGKTIIAGHVAAYLRMQGEIDHTIVIGPAGLRAVWHRTLRAGRVSSAEFSYHTLRQKDRKRDGRLWELDMELDQADENSLIILDEAHWLRNEAATRGKPRLSNQRIQQAVRERGAKILLLTATPYGRSMSEVRSLLNLLPKPKYPVSTSLGLTTNAGEWQLSQLADLARLSPCTVLTTPDVVRHYAQRDEAGERFVEFGQGERRFFPRRIRLQTVHFANPLDELLADLLESRLLYTKDDGRRKPRQLALPWGESAAPGRRNPLQEALFLHEFCSSPAQAKAVCDKLARGGYQYQFARQEELSAFLRLRRREVTGFLKPRRDPKLQKLAELLQSAGDKKVVVFSEYHETARALVRGLKVQLPGLRVATTVGCQDLEELLRRFAPLANEVLADKGDNGPEPQVLVATRALSEGFNLQDAPIVVNYDLPWTVLQLAQRMGRILRPWHVVRDVVIYNFVPSTMGHERVRHARNWERRLEERSAQLRSLAQIPVLVHETSRNQEEEFEMERLGREMFLAEDGADLNLDEVAELLERVEELPTSEFYRDLAMIPDRAEIMGLPPGIRSAVVKGGAKRLFVLLRSGRDRVHAVLADARGRALRESQNREELMSLIRCAPETACAPLDAYPDADDFDAWIGRTRDTWARENGVDDPTRLQIVCAMALVPGRGR